MRCRPLCVLLALLLPGACAAVAADKAAPSKAPAQLKSTQPSDIRRISLEPASLTLQDGRDARKVLVFGETDAKGRFDLTSLAVLKTDSPDIEIDSQGYIHARSKGPASVTVSAAGLLAKLPVTVQSAAVPEVRFVRDIEPLLSKAGCNAGTCHGSAKGKNGFKLSLRGYDPDFDYQALVNDLSGRRIDRVAVEESLMLLKPLAEVPHEGRQAIKPGSREHKLVRQWILEGVHPEAP